MIKSILGGKSKNLFDISKVVTSNRVKRNGNSLICSQYGVSIGTLGSICPMLKPSDLITISFKCASEGAPSNFMAFDGRTFPSGATFLVSEIGLSTPWYLYSTDWAHCDTPNKTTYSDIQIELGSTATEYVPHELTSYKSIIKVSDVCQFIKPNLFYNLTSSGITITNNGDTFTVNGTATKRSSIGTEIKNWTTIIGHKILVSGCPESGGANTFGLGAFNQTGAIDYGNGAIGSVTTTSKFFGILFESGATFNNLVFKPQLFDLTEMFGAGNEPKTVAEFKAKFPNDYYPYSPSCFVTSFDERMPCKTKNLFSSSTEVGIPSSTKSNQSEKRLLEDGKWYVGFSKNNYYRGPQSEWPGNFQYNIWENSISIYTKLDGYGLAKCVYVEPNTKYTISCKVNGPDINIGCGFYQEDGTFISYLSGKEITTPQNCKFMTIVFSLGIDRNKVTHYVSDIQLVKGTTATDYVPYGYV